MRAEADQLANGECEQDQSARNLKISNGDSERFKNNFAEKNKTDRDKQAGENSEKRLALSVLARRARPESQKNRHQSDRIDRYENGNESEQKFLDHFATDEHR